MYDLTLRLQSQLLGVIYDMETFSPTARQERLAWSHSSGTNKGGVVTLTVYEPLPAMKKLTEALEEHWKAMLHAAIADGTQDEHVQHQWFHNALTITSYYHGKTGVMVGIPMRRIVLNRITPEQGCK